jgi:hypothetical protein
VHVLAHRQRPHLAEVAPQEPQRGARDDLAAPFAGRSATWNSRTHW